MKFTDTRHPEERSDVGIHNLKLSTKNWMATHFAALAMTIKAQEDSQDEIYISMA